MKQPEVVFVDASHLIARLHPGDEHHQAALAARDSLGSKVRYVTTDACLMEALDFFSNRSLAARQLAVGAVDDLRQTATVVPASPLLAGALAEYRLHRGRRGERPGVTDLISFEVMRHYGAARALTHDEHFGAAGFTVV